MWPPNLISLLSPTTLEFIEKLWQFVQKFTQVKGLYEVLDYKVMLELQDSYGHQATYHKEEKIRFLQNHIVAYQDQAWGDGNIFAGYDCSPGIPVDCYQEGHRWRVLISLRETKNKGDVETFHIQRGITNGFNQPTENFQTKIDHSTHQLTMSVIFPANRLPKRVALIEENKSHIINPNKEMIQTLPDGRQQVAWQITHPQLHELYSIRWEW